MHLTEVVVSSALLSFICLTTVYVSNSTSKAMKKSMDIDRRGVEVSRINSILASEVRKWRLIDDIYTLEYDISAEDCGPDMAQRMIDEMDLTSKTPNRIEADGRLLVSHNEGWPSIHIYLPQIGFCP